MGGMWGSEIPLIGKSLNKYGKVGQMLATPCAPEPELWVYASWKGIATAIWSIGKPSALSSHGSPTSMSVFGKHGRRNTVNQPGPRYRWNGELMPGPEFQWPEGPGWAMWKIPVMLTRLAGWYLLVYDALASGALAWTSQTYQYAGCPVPGYPMLIGIEGSHLLFPDGDTDTPAGFVSGSNTGVPYSNGEVFISPGQSYTAMYAVTSKPWSVVPNPAGSATGRIRNLSTGEDTQGSDPKPGAGGKMYSAAITRNQHSGNEGHTLRWEATNNTNGFCLIDGSTVYCQIFPFDNILNDP